MRAHTALTLALAALLACSAVAQLPGPFDNEGGPDFADGPMYRLDKEGKVVSLGMVLDSTYSFAQEKEGAVVTEKGVYTSWECADKPGFYRALVNVTYIDYTGEVYKEQQLCEYGTVDETNFENRWAVSEDKCPTATDNVSHFFAATAADRNVTNACGVPERADALDAADELVEGLEGLIKKPAA